MTTGVQSVCAVVPVQHEIQSLHNVLRQLHRAGVRYCVVLVNGSTVDTALRARSLAAQLFQEAYVHHLGESLGPDVPRAVGTYLALRQLPQAERFVYVDGDWKGSFGPILEEFLETGQRDDVLLPAAAPRYDSETSGSQRGLRLDEQLWHAVLCAKYPGLHQAVPSVGPMLVSRRVFARISAFALHQPARFFALCLLARNPAVNIGLFKHWDTRVLGNPARSREHSNKMAETLIGDALEGCRLLLCRRPSRVWKGRLYDGYNSIRRRDVLADWQSRTTTFNAWCSDLPL